MLIIFVILRQMIKEEEINGLVYMHPLDKEPTRYEMVRYSTWRVYFFQELEAMPTEKIGELRTCGSWAEKCPNLITNDEEREFYSYFLNDRKDQILQQDIISHFVCRMLYCYDSANHTKFIDMEKQLLSVRLYRKLTKNEGIRVRQMNLLKHILAHFLKTTPEEYNISLEDWTRFGSKIIHKDMTNKNADKPEMYALIPLEYAEFGLRKRLSFVRRGYVYMNVECTTDLVISLYGLFLKEKLEKMRISVVDLLNNDVENQMSGFIRKTLDTLNNASFDETLINNQFKLNIKNVEGLWKRFFPPCMLNLTQKLKQYNHLKHEGRRQLWLFFKGCGMEVHDNKEYFHRHLASKVSSSDLKSHMYNIEHAYGLVGKRQHEKAKNCRNIITGPAPKKDEHHGCPFHHWRPQDLNEYLRKNYNISEPELDKVMKEQAENHFQVACGRLFEGVAKSEGHSAIPAQITSLLGRSPHQYFQAGMDLVSRGNSSRNDKKVPSEMNTPIAELNSLKF